MMPQIPCVSREGGECGAGQMSQKVPLMGINVATEADNDTKNEV